MNYTAAPNLLSSILLVFGVLPRMPLPTMYLPEKRDRMKYLNTDRSEMIETIDKERLSTARRNNVPGILNWEI